MFLYWLTRGRMAIPPAPVLLGLLLLLAGFLAALPFRAAGGAAAGAPAVMPISGREPDAYAPSAPLPPLLIASSAPPAAPIPDDAETPPAPPAAPLQAIW